MESSTLFEKKPDLKKVLSVVTVPLPSLKKLIGRSPKELSNFVWSGKTIKAKCKLTVATEFRYQSPPRTIINKSSILHSDLTRVVFDSIPASISPSSSSLALNKSSKMH